MQKLDLDTLMNDELGQEEKPFELRYARDTQPVQPEQKTDFVGMPLRDRPNTLDETIQDAKELPFAIADFAAAMLPGAGVSEAVGTGVENPVSSALGKEEAMPIPSLKKDVEEGNYLDAGLKTLGAAGDALTVAGAGMALTGVGSAPGAAMMATGMAAKGIAKYGDDVAKSLAKLFEVDEEAAQVAAKRLDDFAEQDKPVGAATSMLKAEIKKARPKQTVEAKPRVNAPKRQMGLFNRAEEAVVNMDIPEEGIRADALMARLRDDPDVPNDEIDFGIGLMTNPEEMLTREKLDSLFRESFGIVETNRTGSTAQYAGYREYRLPDERDSNYTETIFQLQTAYQEGNTQYELADYFSRMLGYDTVDEYTEAVVDSDLSVAEDLLNPQRSVQVESELDEFLTSQQLGYNDLPDAAKDRVRSDYFKALSSDALNFSQRITDTETLSDAARNTADTMWNDTRAISDAAKSLLKQDNPFTDGGNFESWIDVELQDELVARHGQSAADRMLARVANQRAEGTFLSSADIPEMDNEVGRVLYRSSKHFGMEEKNQLGHMRTSIRTTIDKDDESKRVLVVEEIQADAFKEGGAASGIDLPFKSKAGYTNMMLARAMQMAAEQDLDGIMVLSGAQQIKRNKKGFTNVVDKMESYRTSSTGPKMVALHMKNQDRINLTLDEKGTVVQSGMPELVGKPLHEVIGSKETAKKLIDKDTAVDAEDRVVGESGYKDVYDNRIPKRLNDIAKRMDSDAKVDKGDIYIKIVSPLAERGRTTAASQFLEEENKDLYNLIFQPHSDEFPGFIDDANPQELILREILDDGLEDYAEVYEGYTGDVFLDAFSSIEDVISHAVGEMRGNMKAIDDLASKFSVMYPEKFRNTGAARDFIDNALEDASYMNMVFDSNVLRYKNLTGGDFGGQVDTIKNNTRVMFTPEMKAEILGRGLPRLRTGGLVGKK